LRSHSVIDILDLEGDKQMQVVQGPAGVVGVVGFAMRRRIALSRQIVGWPLFKQHYDRSHRCLHSVTNKDPVQDTLACVSSELLNA
jgi:hypothetical protein